MMLTVVLAYTMIKTQHLVSGANPVISSTIIPEHYSPLEKFYLRDAGVRVAFSVEGFIDRQNKNDPRYVKWLVRLFGTNQGIEYEKILPYHECTEADYQ